MLHQPTVVVRAEEPCIAIPIRVPLSEWGKANALVGETFGWIMARGVPPAGPPFFRYRVIGDMERPFELEVGWPVAAPLEGDGRVISTSIPAGRYVSAIHHGHPDRLMESLTALEGWAASQNLTFDVQTEEGRGDVWTARFERYLTNPEEEPDLNKWSIELLYRLSDNPATIELPNIGNPARRALAHVGITHLDQLTCLTADSVLALHGVGPKAIRILRETLAEHGLAFAGE